MAQPVRRRSWWGWGWEDRAVEGDEAAAVARTMAAFGFAPEDHAPPAVADLSLRAPRVAPPAALAPICSTDPWERAAHTHGKAYRDVARNLLGRLDEPPDVVARPRDEDDVVALLDWCTAAGIAAIPFGGGSSVVGGIEARVGDAYPGAVSIDLSGLDRVLEVDATSRAARVQAGVLGPHLEDQLRPHDWTLRHFPQSFEFSSLGGWIATRAGGHFATGPTHIDDLVESVRAVTPIGVTESRRLPGSGAGPSPDRLLLGSEGTLGIVTEAWVRVQARPRWRAGASVRFPIWADGVAAVRALSQSGLQPANCRLLDGTEAALTSRVSGVGGLLVLGFESADHPVDAWIERAVELCRAHRGELPDGIQRSDAEDAASGAASREGAAGEWRSTFLRAPYTRDALARMGLMAETFETAITWDRFEELHAAVTEAATAAVAEICGLGVVTCRFTHVYADGPAPYFSIYAQGRWGDQVRQWDDVKVAVSEALAGAGGTITHHHAVGRDHRPWYDRQRPDVHATALRAAKSALDPAGVLNPGVLFDPDRFDTRVASRSGTMPAMPTHAEAVALLTAPGGPFAVVPATVDGIEMRVYESRFGSLRDVLALGTGHGDATYIVYGDRRISFADFAGEANGVAAALADAGVVHGDRVAVLAANCPEWGTTFWATVSLGAILVGLNGWWKTDEVLYGLEDSGAKVLVADAKRLERIADVLAEGGLPGLERVYVIDADPAEVGGGDRVRPWSELTAGGAAAPPTTPIDEGDAAVIFYTSGTTGRPKGAISTHRSMVANLQNTVMNTVATRMATEDPGVPSLDGGGQTVGLLTSPLFHVAGCHSNLVVSMLGGVRIVMPTGRFDPLDVLRLIQDEGVQIWATVPTMVWRVCEHPGRHDYDTSAVTTVAFGGSPSAGELQRKVMDTFPNVRFTTNAYGLTESSSVATVLTGDDSTRKPGSVGRPMPVVDIKIDDGSGGSLGPFETGEVCLRGPIIMPGYWGKPEATAEAIRDGWLHTGDVGHVDDEGFLFITDRAKDMIIRGGENVYCVEIEERLVNHPAIADAAVIGVPHDSLGEEVKAVVQLAPGQSITQDEVRAWVGETLAAFKVPTYVELRDEKLPRNASGKLLKNLLRGSGDVSLAETL